MTPVIVEVKPSDVGCSNIAPSSPPGSPTKKARFAHTDSGLISGVSRPLTPTEAWSLYHFETHARKCPECYDPLGVHLKGNRLCDNGHALAQDVAEHVYHRAGEVYSKKTDDHKHVRVEIPPGYDQLRLLLQAIDRAVRSTSRTTPIISYDTNYPVSARRRESSPERRRRYEDEREEVIVEPASSQRRPQRKSSHKSKRYSTVVVNDDVEAEPSRPKPDQRRGSLYDIDLQRQKKDKGYLVEIREPESKDRERERDRTERRRKKDRWA